MPKRIFWFTTFIIILSACRGRQAPTPDDGPVPTPTTPTAVTTPATAIPTDTAPPQPTNTAAPVPDSPPEWPAPMEPLDPLAKTAVTPEQQATFDQLSQELPPERDDVALAVAYLSADSSPAASLAAIESPVVGDHHPFNVANLIDNTNSQIDAVLAAVSEHAYFWFDTGAESPAPDLNVLADVSAAFDAIYETNVTIFGSEDNPGIDGDPRVHIVHASPLALCGSVDCRFAGYFSSENVIPRSANPRSNEREMFIMNVQQFGSGFYLNVLGHEFRHMIEDNHDRGDADWEAEGSATLAEELLGYPESGQQRGNAFLQNPDQQLNSWVDSSVQSTLPYYGQGYVLNRYIYDRLGADLYRQFATSPDYGLRAIDSVAAANDLALTGEQLWLDWLVALAIHNDPAAPDRYRFFGTPLDTAAMTAVNPGDDFDTTVSQYAADYYELPAGSTTLTFRGQTLAPLLNTVPYSGMTMWYAQRANHSNPHLTRTVDLRQVDAATLQYAVYADIELGYDFAYVSASVDDGRTWQGLIADNMQGLAPEDNPSDSAFTERFYTGRTQTWIEERVDLSPYAGQVIQIRFEYVTDLILTFGGLALDNIAIPEIGFYDSAETLAPGWTAEGFTRAAAYLPQTWHLQLITFDAGAPAVETLTLAGDQMLSLTLDEAERPLLIIAATAPYTLEPAHYRLTLAE